ncbi:MAG: RHS repeat protein, partial [Anaerolineae bacterium]|nr:RHS repeat protein [Anaerolineae bacterium]
MPYARTRVARWQGRATGHYDLAGDLTTQTDARGCVTGFTYDGLNRLTGKSTSGATYDQAGYGESLGRRTAMTDTSGSTTWAYDVRGRVTQAVKLIGTQPFTTSTSYDALDRVVTTTYPDGEVVTTAYNAATQPQSLSGSSTYVSETLYSAVGQLTRRTLGNGLVTTY